MKIQDGCNHRCSYCIVPLVRGNCRSVSTDDVLDEARHIAATDAAEVVLTGIDVGSWGCDLSPRQELADLLQSLLDLGTGMRFRLASIEPHGITPALLSLFTGCEDICGHLHVPLQSGSNRILTAMRRPYLREDLMARLQPAVANRMPLGLGMDVIVGFPGETDADFADTLSLVESLPVTYLHVFPFSPRPGTPAATLGPEVPYAVKMARCAVLRKFSDTRKQAHVESLIGSEVDVVDVRQVRGTVDVVESMGSDYTVIHRRSPGGLQPGRFRVSISGSRGTIALASEVP